MIIHGGTGNGYAAKVNAANKLTTFATMQTMINHVSNDEGEAYTLPFTQATDAGADAIILYIKNTSDKNLVISQIWLSCTAADTLYTKIGMTGTAAGGTVPVPINMNSSSANKAAATVHQHTDITGLTGGNMTWRSYFTANAISQRIYFDDGFILGRNGVWTLHATTAQANTVQGTLVFFFHD